MPKNSPPRRFAFLFALACVFAPFPFFAGDVAPDANASLSALGDANVRNAYVEWYLPKMGINQGLEKIGAIEGGFECSHWMPSDNGGYGC